MRVRVRGGGSATGKDCLVDLVIQLIVGVIAGFLAVVAVYRTIPDTVLAWVGVVVLGLLGGWVGGLLADLLGLDAVNWIGSIVIAFAAAVAFLLALQRVSPSK